MTEANPQGADLQTAADRIGTLIDPPTKEASDDVKNEVKAEVPQEKAAPAPEVKATEQLEQAPEDAQDQPQEAATQETQEQPDFSSVQELAEALGLPVDEFLGKIKGKVKLNGVEQDVTLADMRNGYQMEADYRRKTAELAETRKAFEAEREQIAQALTQRYTESEQISTFLEQQLTNEFNSVDWQTLRVTDPAEFAAKRAEYQERHAQIQQIREGVRAQIKAREDELNAKQSEQLRQVIQEESEKLAAAIPDFRDEAKAKEIRGQIKDYLRSLGYQDSEISGIYDHRQVLIVRDAMEYRKLKSKSVETKNKVVNAPKLQKPGSTQGKGNSEQATFRERLARLKKTGRVEDAAHLIKI